jgi:hypothetical protein
MSGLRQIGGHPATHIAKPDECDACHRAPLFSRHYEEQGDEAIQQR